MPRIIEIHRDKDGELHREDGPAIIYADGTQEWWYHGELHREDGPALIYADGTQYWYYHGERVTNQVEQWCEERNLDIDNLSDEDIFALQFAMKEFI